MKVSKAQVQANRAHIVETASRLFRERGYDGVGVADLMAAAGFTHGGFYKHFQSKAELMAEATACGLARSADSGAGVDEAAFMAAYVSRQHRDSRSDGCTLAALGGDAARQPAAIKTEFATGIENHLKRLLGDHSGTERRATAINMIAHAVGAIVLSRACPDDSPLADEILDACRREILAALSASPTPTAAPANQP